jgi:Domain of unknown function (DUF397)
VSAEDLSWRKSRRSMNGGNCLEAASTSCAVLVRDTTDCGGPVLAYSPAAWTAFLASVKAAAL